MFIFALLDTLGGGPDILTRRLLLGALAVFIITRMINMALVFDWLAKSGMDDAYLTLGIVYAVTALVGGGIYLTYQYAMDSSMVSVALTSAVFAFMVVKITDYEYTQSDETLMSG